MTPPPLLTTCIFLDPNQFDKDDNNCNDYFGDFGDFGGFNHLSKAFKELEVHAKDVVVQGVKVRRHLY